METVEGNARESNSLKNLTKKINCANIQKYCLKRS